VAPGAARWRPRRRYAARGRVAARRGTAPMPHSRAPRRPGSARAPVS